MEHDARTSVDSLACLLSPWRAGGSIGRTVYAVFGIKAEAHARDEDSVVIGMMDTAQLAEAVVVSHNEWLAKHRRRNATR